MAINSNLKRLMLELNRKSPILIFKDARLNKAVKKGSQFLTFNR